MIKKGMFFISRLSLVISLSFIRLILCELLLIIEMNCHYSDKMTCFNTQIKFFVVDTSFNSLMLIAEIPCNMCFDKSIFFGSIFVLVFNDMDRLIKYDDC